MKKIQNEDFTGKKVLMRVDFNVAVENGQAKEKYKLLSARESVEYVLKYKGVKLALVSHLGRPDGQVKEEFSFSRLADDVVDALGVNVRFSKDCVGLSVEQNLGALGAGEVLLLENVRFYQGEEENDPRFAKQLAEPFDVFINEAFSVCHRDQSSVTGVTEFLPSYAGLWLQKEMENLDKALNSPETPAVAIIGGAKIETKLPLIKKFEDIYDHVLVGGKIANEALDQGITFSEKVILPTDFLGDRSDIGAETTERFKEIISTAKTVVWNGPMGKFEQSPYDTATWEILDAVVASGAFTLVGGGESVQALEEKNSLDKVSFVSTGGGAMLEYLSGERMPGVEALKKN